MFIHAAIIMLTTTHTHTHTHINVSLISGVYPHIPLSRLVLSSALSSSLVSSAHAAFLDLWSASVYHACLESPSALGVLPALSIDYLEIEVMQFQSPSLICLEGSFKHSHLSDRSSIGRVVQLSPAATALFVIDLRGTASGHLLAIQTQVSK